MSGGPCALLLVAHGSRLPDANAEIAQLAQRLRQEAGDRYAIVAHAFLEIAEPDIPAGIDACVAQGAERLDVLPYFLAAGRHVRDDIPAIVAEARERHPKVRINLRPYLGREPQLPKMLLALAEPQ